MFSNDQDKFKEARYQRKLSLLNKVQQKYNNVKGANTSLLQVNDQVQSRCPLLHSSNSASTIDIPTSSNTSQTLQSHSRDNLTSINDIHQLPCHQGFP